MLSCFLLFFTTASALRGITRGSGNEGNVLFMIWLSSKGRAAENEERVDYIARFIERGTSRHPKFDYQRNAITPFLPHDYHTGAVLGELSRLIEVGARHISSRRAFDHHQR